MTEAKIHLSNLESELIKNQEWILTKQVVMNKIYLLFGTLHDTYKELQQKEDIYFPILHKTVSGKISKGENYEGLPYVMLDYPAFFSKENIFAIRTMFWWGNFFSITLHTSGKDFKIKRNSSENLTYLQKNNFFICINESEWQHNFDITNYTSIENLNEVQFKKITEKGFLKISKKLDINRWQEAPEFLEKSFREITGFIKISFQGDEKVLSPAFPRAGSGL